MKYNKIPNTDMDVSAICLGTMTFGTPVAEPDAVKLVQWALDHGVNFIDTANIYEGYARYAGSAGGVAELFLGKALKSGYREKAIVATKLGNKVGTASEDDGTSPAAIRKQLDASLKRMDIDCIDIYYLHKPDVHHTPLTDIIGALQEAIKAGKIRYYGISNYSFEETAELLQVADKHNLPRPVIHQPQFSLLNPSIEKNLLPLCKKENIAVSPYMVLEGGLLTGKYRRGRPVPAESRKMEKEDWVADLNDELFDRLEAIEQDAKAKNRTLMRHAILESLARPAVVSLVIGSKRPAQLHEIMQCVE